MSPPKPWVTFRQPDAEQQYLALLTELPLKRFRDLGAFFLYTAKVQGQLQRTPGLLGYSLLAHVFKRQFWTLSVWEGETDLQHFVAENPHRSVMTGLQGKMGQTSFQRWSIRGSEYPPTWQQAFAQQRAGYSGVHSG